MSFETMAFKSQEIPEDKKNDIEDEGYFSKAWGGFKNKLVEYTSEDSAFGKSVDWTKDKIETLSKSDRLKFLEGLANIGNNIDSFKNGKLQEISLGFAMICEKNKTLKDYFLTGAEIYGEKKEEADEALEKSAKGELKDLGRVKGAGRGLAGNLLRYGRIIHDFDRANPLRNAMAVSMFVGSQSEQIKKTRFKSEELLNKTRIGQLNEEGELINEADFDRAWEEAYELYKKAEKKGDSEKVSAEDLNKVYRENLPADVLKRFERNEDGEALKWMQKGMTWHMKHGAEKVMKELDSIEKADISEPEKETKRQAILARNKKLLDDLDSMVEDQGTIDTFSYVSRLAEKGGKTATTVLTVETGFKTAANLGKIGVKMGKSFLNWEGGAYGDELKNPSFEVVKRFPVEKGKIPLKAGMLPGNQENSILKKSEGFEPKHKDSAFLRKDDQNPPMKDLSSKVATGLKGGDISHNQIINQETGQLKEKNFQIAEGVKAKRGDSIWTVAEKYLAGNKEFKALKGEGKLHEALETYNIDRIKDAIVENPTEYGLAENVNVDKLTIKQINSIDWQKAFNNTYQEGGVTKNLSDAKVEGILESNKVEAKALHANNATNLDKTSHADSAVDLDKFEKVKTPEVPVDDTHIHIDNQLVIEKDSQFADEWKEWKERKAIDFANGKYGEAITSYKPVSEPGKMEWEQKIQATRPDMAEIDHRELLRERLHNVNDLVGAPTANESIEDYMGRYNIANTEANASLYKNLIHERIVNSDPRIKDIIWNRIDRMPSALKGAVVDNFDSNKGIVKGYLNLVSGDKASVAEGVKQIFDYTKVNPADIDVRSNGSIVYSNAFGREGYDLVLSQDKIGVDGPWSRNWNVSGLAGKTPEGKLSLDSIKDSKAWIINDSVGKEGPEPEIIKPIQEGETVEKVEGDKSGSVAQAGEKTTGKVIAEQQSEKNIPKKERQAEQEVKEAKISVNMSKIMEDAKKNTSKNDGGKGKISELYGIHKDDLEEVTKATSDGKEALAKEEISADKIDNDIKGEKEPVGSEPEKAGAEVKGDQEKKVYEVPAVENSEEVINKTVKIGNMTYTINAEGDKFQINSEGTTKIDNKAIAKWLNIDELRKLPDEKALRGVRIAGNEINNLSQVYDEIKGQDPTPENQKILSLLKKTIDSKIDHVNNQYNTEAIKPFGSNSEGIIDNDIKGEKEPVGPEPEIIKPIKGGKIVSDREKSKTSVNMSKIMEEAQADVGEGLQTKESSDKS